jgi:tRNA nucleotidyltransferase (CCA-adding enzyme)
MDKRETVFYLFEGVVNNDNKETSFAKFTKLVNKTLKKTSEYNPVRHIIVQNKLHNFAVVEYETDELPPIKQVKGPEVFRKEACDNFIEKHQKTYVLGDRLMAEKPREDNLNDIIDTIPFADSYWFEFLDTWSDKRFTEEYLFDLRKELTKMLGLKL